MRQTTCHNREILHSYLESKLPNEVWLVKEFLGHGLVSDGCLYARLNFSRTGLLALTCLSAGTTPIFFQGNQAEIEQQKSVPANSIQEEDGARNLFLLGDEAVPSLIKFLSVSDKAVRASAARGLAYIGNQQGMQALRIAVKAERDKETKAAMSCFLAGGLVETKSESDLNFLRSTIERTQLVADDDETAFSAVCAALALGTRGGGDSIAVLRKVVKVDVLGVEETGKAIRWIENKSTRREAPVG